MEHLKTGPRNTAMVGDRPGTDMWGAHRAGIKHTILVEPYSEAFGGKKPGAIIRLARAAEKRWLIS
jgi:predicted HAD superfamily phosphohydrolase YqeG